ncbi:PTS sugar transporter subunit IIB [Irregularibacter muris]|uniref:PTS sugar transporter subunit IIB n=1 Tax=Irregularibacter muris TaxID=1796619 RepID=A0AAE3HHJ7_9FIRM|nr:PTS sugar transporter subunit IIB [Irregularibacter muris]MCR1898703.1 PTS sugar transporter subunit IIB [Irregularibacter muris]
MKNILLACGSGICTSTAVRNKVAQILDEHGYKGKYKITQCKVAETPAMSSNYDFLISTTMVPKELKCPFVPGVCFLTNVNTQPSIDKILELMEK